MIGKWWMKDCADLMIFNGAAFVGAYIERQLIVRAIQERKKESCIATVVVFNTWKRNIHKNNTAPFQT